MSYSLGIDFGTSTTKISLGLDDGKLIPLPISSQGDKVFMPSVIAYTKLPNNKAAVFAVGEDAQNLSLSADYQVVEDIKRFLEVKESVPRDFPFKDYPWWDNEQQCVQLWESTFRVKDVIYEILSVALDRAIQRARVLYQLPLPIEDRWELLKDWPVRFGCSVTAGIETRRALYDVALRLGFCNITFTDIHAEPALASLPYLEQGLKAGDIILVNDWGGGTFDTAVVRVDSIEADNVPVITVLSSDGVPFNCGGTDIDKAFAKHLKNEISREYSNDGQYTERDQNLLEKEARNAKEILSDREDYTIVMPPYFLNRSGIEITVTRKQLEQVIEGIEILGGSKDCVLRAWKQARMVYRRDEEVSGEYYLEKDSQKGTISNFITQLDFDDLNENVNRVLLIGGTTKIPMLREWVASIIDGNKFIPEGGQYMPIVACSLGGASQRKDISSIVDRLPFSVFVKQGNNKQQMYHAYTPTVSYKVLANNQEIRPYISDKVFEVSEETNTVLVECISPDGVTIHKQSYSDLLPGRYVFEINSYGCFSLKGIPHDISEELYNPAQHELQIAQWEKCLQEKEIQDQEERKRANKQLFKKLGEDHNLEVG